MPLFWGGKEGPMGEERYLHIYVGGCQNYGPFLDPYYTTAHNIQGTQKGDHNFDNHPCVEYGRIVIVWRICCHL